MQSLRIYLLTRILLVALISLILIWSGVPWWIVSVVFVLAAGFFVWAPLSGRYRVVDENHAAPLRMDERGRQVRDRAGRNAFLITQALTLGLFLYGQFQEPQSIQTAAMGTVLGIGMLSYLVLSVCYERESIRN
jgi:hypothetical protein